MWVFSCICMYLHRISPSNTLPTATVATDCGLNKVQLQTTHSLKRSVNFLTSVKCTVTIMRDPLSDDPKEPKEWIALCIA